MKKIIMMLVCLSVLCSGCSYYKLTTIKLRGEEISFPIGEIFPVKGKNVSGTITRQVSLVSGKNKPQVLLDIKTTDEDNKGELEVKK